MQFLTLGDLFDFVTTYFWKLTAIASVWYIILPYFIKIQNLTYHWNFWPLVTLRLFFLKSWRQERYFDVKILNITENLKFDTWPDIFYSFSLIILSYYLAKFDQFVIFTKFVIFIKFEKMAANTGETSCQ